MVAVEGRRIKPAAASDGTAVLDEFSRKFRHPRAPIRKEGSYFNPVYPGR
jgi:hypothetical protein